MFENYRKCLIIWHFAPTNLTILNPPYFHIFDPSWFDLFCQFKIFYKDWDWKWFSTAVSFKKWEHSFIGTPKSLWQFSVPISVASSSLRSRIFSFRSRRHFVQVPARGRSSPFHPGPFFSLLRVRAAGRTDLLQLSSTFRLISHAWRQ